MSDSVSAHCSLVKNFPLNLDIYKHANEMENPRQSSETSRSPDPPRWLIVSTNDERGNIFKLKKYLNKKLGHVNAPKITRFGRNKFLVHTNSDGQAAMLLNLKLDENDLIKKVSPHYNFSYARGVIFNEDLYELPSYEILEMCSERVWKVFKVPKSSMIILTFTNSELPFQISIENEIMRVRPYRPRVLQCFTCYGFGHASKVCTRVKICQRCAQPEHGDCNNPKICINCKGSHHARDKECSMYKKEQEALLISFAEHISVGQAKKILARNTLYSDKVKFPRSNTASTSTTSHVGTSIVTQATASQASTGESPRALSGGASQGSSGEASRASPAGASGVPFAGTSKTPSKIPRSPIKASGDSSVNSETWHAPGSSGGSGAQSQSLKSLDEFSLSGDSPAFESLPDPTVTIHRSDTGEDMEAISVRQKRARTPSSRSSSRSSIHGKSSKNETGTSVGGQSSKTSSSERTGRLKENKNASGKISLSRQKNFNQIEPNKKVPKPK